jgi:aspartate/methionine/tyrosine aminotransferase
MTTLSVQAFGLEKKFPLLQKIERCDLSIGEPKLSPLPADTFDNLNSIKNINYYYPSHGDLALREIILKKYYHNLDVGNLAITHGTIGALDFIFRANLDENSEILIPDPGFPPYSKLAEFSGSKVKKYSINLDNQSELFIDWNQVESLINHNTKLILINSPHNPTGKIFGEADYLRFKEILNNYPQISFILDEVYRDLIYSNKKHQDFSSFISRGYIVGSFSKMFPLQGARIGWVLTSVENMKGLTPYFNNATGSISSFGQEIAKKLLQKELSFKDIYAAAALDAKKILDFYHVDYIVPEGAFFIFIKYKINGSIVADELSDLGVDVIPGSAFGENGLHYIRASFAQEKNTLTNGFSIIARHWHEIHLKVLQ